jgi:hypothetical protein
MFGLMLTAFGSAGFTDVGANAAEFFCFFTSYAHELGCGVANGSTFHVKLNASCHHFDVLFLCTGTGTMVTDSGTAKAGVNALFVLMITVHHDNLFCCVIRMAQKADQ